MENGSPLWDMNLDWVHTAGFTKLISQKNGNNNNDDEEEEEGEMCKLEAIARPHRVQMNALVYNKVKHLSNMKYRYFQIDNNIMPRKFHHKLKIQ